MRKLTYSQAIVDAVDNAMGLDNKVILMGQLVDYKGAIFKTTTGLVEKYGHQRVMDFPNAESVMTAVAIGSAVTGMRPIIVHPRIDFMMYSLDAIVNWMSLWRFKSNGHCHLPVTIRAIVGKGWGQGPQHSKSMHSWFAHLPGLRVAMPATAYDLKGLLLENIFGENPGIIIESRCLFGMEDHVPEQPYRVRFGEACVRKEGRDITCVAIGMMVPAVLKAAEKLEKENISVEVIDPRTIAPLDKDTIRRSVVKTGRLIVADPDWIYCGIASEIIAFICEEMGTKLKAAPGRICFPQSHTPMSYVLENQYYPDEASIIERIKGILSIR
ncbi:MAG: hypothetical protein A2X48_04465 [Lentisphaerae bacterium GWF2_49_21]|nr:MAG: hypothetical protein A2X48_04465 [Lentisphaerae bacterium GWF2_49_21]